MPRLVVVELTVTGLLTGDGVTDTRDVIVYLRYWAKQDPHADWDRDGTVDADDLGVFLNAWVAGC